MSNGRYKVHFDSISGKKPEEPTKEQLEQRERDKLEVQQKRKEWEEKATEVEGVPGRCVVVGRDEVQFFLDRELLEEWQQDNESVLYYYNDIQILSGSAGYVLKKSDGTSIRQVTVMS
jgi:hypothetical protein